jgi:hypothetical protein
MLIEWQPSGDRRFFGYRIYRSTGSIEDISGLDPFLYQNGSHALNSTYDHDIEENVTYYYTVTAVDTGGNELRTGLSWVSGTYPYTPPPRPPPEDDDDDDDWDSRRKAYIGVSIALILLLLAGIAILGFMVLQNKPNDYDEFEE